MVIRPEKKKIRTNISAYDILLLEHLEFFPGFFALLYPNSVTSTFLKRNVGKYSQFPFMEDSPLCLPLCLVHCLAISLFPS